MSLYKVHFGDGPAVSSVETADGEQPGRAWIDESSSKPEMKWLVVDAAHETEAGEMAAVAARIIWGTYLDW